MALMDKLQPVLDGLAVFSGCLKTGKQVKQRGGLMGGGRIQFAAGTPVCRFILEIRSKTYRERERVIKNNKIKGERT